MASHGVFPDFPLVIVPQGGQCPSSSLHQLLQDLHEQQPYAIAIVNFYCST